MTPQTKLQSTKTNKDNSEQPVPKLPPWLQMKQQGKIQLEKGRLVQDNLSKFGTLIAYLTKIVPVYQAKNSPWMRIIELIGLTILIVLSSNIMYLWMILLLLMVHLIILPGTIIVNICKKLVKLLIISAIVLLPSLLLRANNIGLFLSRVTLVMLNISIFLSINSWPQFILGLKQLHCPSVIILTLDITMKYVYTLGNYIQELLNSIKLRTCGQHVNRKMMGVILGQVYLSAKKRTTDLYNAMLLRGYSNNKTANLKITWNKYDLISMGELLFATVAYFITRGVVA
ncbi:energy-coupling factor transporter transmembrane protein EcfT [Limosilactobacillus reuteri]|uniref:Cobalt transport protein n=1 Tax=Limosilactobacillus reuteri TaxID=1598 RepID=A0A073JMV0_LIMRT|nr:energy-coupling factor transporter transmembrane component T [Limosilactobacillus reuteri]KEK14507.1 cobalt transport protein [Limosilactobacillus reuteri]MCC4323872.1 energy-coupling factor transporter transmembrane protein EcfT [Limosilactobacillus reuteri]MCC4334614.1 energy-coupling factor transporter transmembrane protein EcfT [Limosilactobacillus reuteri]